MDLAQSIVELGKAASGRRNTRKTLVEATETVATAINRQLRAGDKVTITIEEPYQGDVVARDVDYQVMRVTWPVSQWAMVDNRPSEGSPHPEGNEALVREGTAVFEDMRESHWDGHNVCEVVGRRLMSFRFAQLALEYGVEDEEPDLHFATAEERLAFAREVPLVIEAYRELLNSQAREFAEAAGKVTKTVVR